MTTLRQLNAELRKRGIKEELVKGKGYFYFDGGDAHEWYSTSIPVYSISDLTLDYVLSEHERLSTEHRGGRYNTLSSTYRPDWERSCGLVTSTFQSRLIALASSPEPTLAEYRQALRAVAFKQETAGIASDLLIKIKGWFASLKGLVDLPAKDLVAALSTSKVYKFLKTIQFNLSAILRGLNEAMSLLHKGLSRVFQQLADSGVVTKLRSGAMKIDELLKQYPLLSRVTGIVIAGLLFYMWLNMSFTGRFESDFDLTSVAQALRGNFSLADFFTGPGLLDEFLFILGASTGLSFPWLASSLGCVILALLYTGFIHLKDNPKLTALRKKMHFGNP